MPSHYKEKEDESRAERADVDRYEYEQGKEAGEEQAAAAPQAGGIADFDTSGRGSHDAEGKGVNAAGTETIPDNIAQANQASVAAKALAYDPATVYVPQVGAEEVEEHLNAMFDGQELSEEFKTKAGTIFEAAVNSKINEFAQQLDETYRQILTEQLEEVVGNLAERLDDYLNYVVDEWMGKNELAVDRGIKTDISESFIKGLRSLFEAHYVNIPDERYDVLDELFESNEQLQDELNEQINNNVHLSTQLNESAKVQIFNHYAQDLADTEIEKFGVLAESVGYDTAEEYSGKLAQIRESYFNNNAPISEPVELIEETTNPRISNGSAMDKYVDTLAFHMRDKNK
jgi:mRNA-degrading endonuclease RelE of RelBE toxin-antitoxin system